MYALDLATQHEEWLERTETKYSTLVLCRLKKMKGKKTNAGVYALDLATQCGHLIPAAASSSGTLCAFVCVFVSLCVCLCVQVPLCLWRVCVCVCVVFLYKRMCVHAPPHVCVRVWYIIANPDLIPATNKNSTESIVC